MEEEFSEKFDFDQTDYEFAIGARRFKRQTEEQRIYGIWARDEEDEEDGRPSFSFGKKRSSGPVKFVSTGVERTELSKESTSNELPDEITVEARPEKRSKFTSFEQTTFNSVGSQVFAGFRNAAFQSTSSTGGDAGWLKSGKGNVIMQMMQKMGYEHGRGLGKSKQGIVEPVQAVQRPGRGAVGAYGSEAQGPKFGESAAEAQNRITRKGLNDLSESETAAFPTRGTWRKSNTGRVKIQYKTLNEVISEGENQRFGDIGLSSTNNSIIDMTGPEQRIYEDFNSFSRRARMPLVADVERSNFNVPELTHNLNTLLDATEEEICKTDRQVRYLKDQNEVLLNEQTRIEEELADSNAELFRLEEIERIIRCFYQESSLEDTTLDECRDLFVILREKYSVEYKLYGLDAIAIPVLLPKISKYFSNWDPLDPEQTCYGFEMMEDWKEVLGSTKGSSLFKHFDKDSNSSISAYDHCLWSGWMPSMRKAALSWDSRNNGPVMILAPRIHSKVEEWDPTTDTIPIETWLHPWHAIMGDRLLHTYATLRQKLAKGLHNWIPGDRSAIESIRPWKEIFSSSTLFTFISMNIIPKLSRYIQNIDITNTEQFEYIELFDWLELINIDVIAQILAKNFFPRYFQQINYQINNLNISIGELEKIKKGYMDWKNLLPTEIQKHALIMTELRRILQLLASCQNRLTGLPIPQQSKSSQSSFTQNLISSSSSSISSSGPFGLPPPSQQFTSQLPPNSFKHLVETSAISNGIQFFPQRSKFHDGKQVYMFGDYSVYIDGTILFYYNPPKRQWLPASLNQLLDMCRNK